METVLRENDIYKLTYKIKWDLRTSEGKDTNYSYLLRELEEISDN